MIVLYETENTIDPRKLSEYRTKGYRVASIFADPKINRGEAVGFILDKLYKTTIYYIEYLINTGHKLTLQLGDETYKLNIPADWKYSYTHETDMLKYTTIKHPILQQYEKQLKEYKAIQKDYKEELKRQELARSLGGTPNDLEDFVRTFARLYQLDYNSESKTEQLELYRQIKFYINNNIEYAVEPSGISPDETPYFSSDMFKWSYEPEITEESFGDETYFEDVCNKERRLS